MALSDDIAGLPTLGSPGLTGHTRDHKTLHAAVKAHDLQLRDTGWVTLTANIPGTLQVRRVGTQVMVTGLSLRPAGEGTVVVVDLPEGFRPSSTVVGAADENGAPRSAFALSYSPYRVEVRGVGAASTYVALSVSFFTADSWPQS